MKGLKYSWKVRDGMHEPFAKSLQWIRRVVFRVKPLPPDIPLPNWISEVWDKRWKETERANISFLRGCAHMEIYLPSFSQDSNRFSNITIEWEKFPEWRDES